MRPRGFRIKTALCRSTTAGYHGRMADEPPALTIAAETDQRKIDKRRALDHLHWPTRELAANLLRVMRGAGRPIELPGQIIELAIAIQEAGRLTNVWYIGTEIEEVLQSAFPKTSERWPDERAENIIASGALQLLASTLVSQRAQAVAGSRELHEGVEHMEAARRRNREEAQLEILRYREQTRKPPAPKRRRAKPKPKQTPKPKQAVEDAAPRPSSTAEFMRSQRQRRED
jgi:hypothetical protein